jgi:hypothetical protein
MTCRRHFDFFFADEGVAEELAANADEEDDYYDYGEEEENEHDEF